ncbi:MAG: ABC transporter permease [Arachnia sp.]
MDIAWFLLGIAVMAGASVALARWAGVGLGWEPVIALLRAALQLAAIAAILSGVLAVPWLVVAFLALMLTTASWTAGRRLAGIPHGRRYALIGVISGAAAGLIPAFAMGLVEIDPRQIIALGGIVIGNAMTASTLAGRNFRTTAIARGGEVEAWLGLGAYPSRAYRDIGTQAVRESLLPTMDQTKSTGLVTLPGAFVGALFGGANPLEAAQFQLVVLAAIMLSMLTTATIVTRLAGRTHYVMTNDQAPVELPRAHNAVPQ